MNFPKSIIDFHIDIYNDHLIKTDNIIGFKNKYFNNSIMTPNFCLKGEISKDEFFEHKKYLGREKYWINNFSKFNNGLNPIFKVTAHFQYIMNTKKMKFNHIPNFEYMILKSISSNMMNEFQKVTHLNSNGLDLSTQSKIADVINESRAKIEYLFVFYKGHIVGGYTMLHGIDSTLLINCSLDEPYRKMGIFKEMLGRGVNYCLDLGQASTFYWTFNDKLKNRGDRKEEMSIYSYFH